MTITEASTDAAALRAAAHAEYRRSLAEGVPLTGVALGQQFGRSARWARRRIAEVHGQATVADDGGTAAAPGRAVPELLIETAVATPVPEDPAATEVGSESPRATQVAGTAVTDLANVSAPAAPHPRGYWWALGSFLGAVTLSVCANVGHTLHPLTAASPPGSPAVAPDPGAVVAAASWPLLLLGAVEVVTRVSWPRGLWWGLTRYGAAVFVAVIAAIMSYRHMVALLVTYGEDTLSAHLGPLAVDGLILVSGVALLALGLQRRAVIE